MPMHDHGAMGGEAMPMAMPKAGEPAATPTPMHDHGTAGGEAMPMPAAPSGPDMPHAHPAGQ
jgi:hypothetical protein